MPPRKTNEQYKQLARSIEDGLPNGICKAPKDAGYSEAVSRQGWNAVPEKIWRRLSGKAKKLMEIGKELTPGTQADLVRGRLAHNTVTGTDGGAQSTKLLGSDRRVNMFVPDSQTGVIVLTPPQALVEKAEKILAELSPAADSGQ